MSKNTHPLRLFRCEKAQREFSVCKFSARRAKIQVFLFVFSEPQPKFYFWGDKIKCKQNFTIAKHNWQLFSNLLCEKQRLTINVE